MKLVLLALSLLFASCSTTQKQSRETPNSQTSIDSVYKEAQKEFNKRNYQKSLELFQQYLTGHKLSKNEKELFWAIDQIGRIYLTVEKSPKKAIEFFEKTLQEIQLNDAYEDNIQEWISVSKEWQKLSKMPKNVKKADDLFHLGKKFYDQGKTKLKFPADQSGNADFYIAATYLIPYVFNYDDGKYIGESLLMLGSIRFRSWNDYEYWTENFYLKEVIRRFPNTELSWKAYRILRNGIIIGYTGSGGDSTPPSQLRMLKRLEELAKPKKTNNKLKR